jgi:hypothetical protein
MNKKEVLLLALSGGHRFSPVQVQKLFFLIDKNVGAQIGGPFFNFSPYDYGPFDKAVYNELSSLKDTGLIEVYDNSHPSQRCYLLSKAGEVEAEDVLKRQQPQVVDYILSLSRFVRSLSFKDLVSAIYKAYPDMKINSIFAE